MGLQVTIQVICTNMNKNIDEEDKFQKLQFQFFFFLEEDEQRLLRTILSATKITPGTKRARVTKWMLA